MFLLLAGSRAALVAVSKRTLAKSHLCSHSTVAWQKMMLLQSRAALVAASKKDFIPTRFMARWQGEAGWQPGHQACCYWSGRPGCQWTVIRRKPLSSKGELTTPSLSFMQVAGPNRCFGSCTMSFLPRLFQARESSASREKASLKSFIGEGAQVGGTWWTDKLPTVRGPKSGIF